MDGCFLILVLEMELFSEGLNNTLCWISESLNSFNSKDKGQLPSLLGLFRNMEGRSLA